MPRGAHFTPAHQQAAARKRVEQSSFLEHNRTIARDGACACSALMRAPSGSRLLHSEDVQFLFLEDLHPSRDRSQKISEKDRRLLYGRYVWDAIWYGLNAPGKPDADTFLKRSLEIRKSLWGKTQLDDPLEVVYIAPNDFCQSDGSLLRREKQRAAFRMALRVGREAAQVWSKAVADERAGDHHHSRSVGRRVPLQTATPVFARRQK